VHGKGRDASPGGRAEIYDFRKAGVEQRVSLRCNRNSNQIGVFNLASELDQNNFLGSVDCDVYAQVGRLNTMRSIAKSANGQGEGAALE